MQKRKFSSFSFVKQYIRRKYSRCPTAFILALLLVTAGNILLLRASWTIWNAAIISMRFINTRMYACTCVYVCMYAKGISYARHVKKHPPLSLSLSDCVCLSACLSLPLSPAPLHERQWPKWINLPYPSLSLSLCFLFFFVVRLFLLLLLLLPSLSFPSSSYFTTGLFSVILHQRHRQWNAR